MKKAKIPLRRARCAVVFLCLLFVAFAVPVAKRAWDWRQDPTEVVAMIVDREWNSEQGLKEKNSQIRIVSRNSVPLLEKVKSQEWVSEDSIDLKRFAEERNQEDVWISSVGASQKGTFCRWVSVGYRPKRVRGDSNVVFLCGGSTQCEVRPRIKWLLMGIGPKYEISRTIHIIS